MEEANLVRLWWTDVWLYAVTSKTSRHSTGWQAKCRSL